MLTLPWRFIAAGTLAVAAAACQPPAVRAPASSDAILKAQTQELMDAVSTGDVKVWDKYVDPRIIYVSEDGTVETKQSLMKQIAPLPPGISGKITTIDFAIQYFGDTAVVKHVADEAEDYFGHAIHAQYITCATWRHGASGWKLVGQEIFATLIDPPSISLPADQLDEYTGTYELTKDITYAISREGDHLLGSRNGKPPQVLRVEARDVLFIPGQPRSRKVFLRDASGRIDRLADRREGRDIVWRRRRP